ncbi:MAG: hypothetical protein RBS80_08380 [Thermoguttaceae bacterium]|jgi:hypothetical protein|nr:hypothetical protein [Thermoguttaceae bacterium]
MQIARIGSSAAAWTLAAAGILYGASAADDQLPEGTVWLTPERIAATSGPAYGTREQPGAGFHTLYGAARAIDDDPATFCCLLDDTPDAAGGNPKAMPPSGSRPVTGHIVFDLGRPLEVVGVQLISRDSSGTYNPKNVDLFHFAADDPAQHAAAADLEGDAGIRTLVAAHDVPPLTQGAAETIPCPPVRARYVGLRVNDSYEAGPLHYNFQLAGFRVAVRLADDDKRWLAEKAQSGRLAKLAGQIETLRRAVDFLRLEYADDYPGEVLLDEIERFERELKAAVAEPWRKGSLTSDALVVSLEELKRRALVVANPLLQPGKLLFVKRNTYQTHWYYSEFMQAGPPGGNLCVLDLATGEVTALCPELEGGIFDRFDLSFDGRRVVFGYRPAPGKAFRLYEVGTDGTGLRQLTFDPPGEAERLASYGLDSTRNELGPYRGHTDDFHPCYLPDGRIVFASSRCERGVLCDASDNLSVNVLYRIDADGGNMTLLSENALSESTPSVMNDGRILYTRWEYVYKGVIAVQSLWAMRPDGSGSVEIYGNRHVYPPVLIHARAVPGYNDLFVATCTMHHPFAVGPLLLVDVSKNIRTHAPLRNLTPYVDVSYEGAGTFGSGGESFIHFKDAQWLRENPGRQADFRTGRPIHSEPGQWVRDNTGPLYCDPWPLSDNFFLVSRNPDKAHNHGTAYGLWLIDTFGNRVLVHDDPDISCWQPVPLRPRPVPPIVPPVTLPEGRAAEGASAAETKTAGAGNAEATLMMADVYRGLEGIERGEVKYLRILEQVPRPWTARRFWPDDITNGQNAAISLGAHIFVTVLHGVVPVEEDGSAHFTVPACRSVFFQALDENYMELERMRTFVNLQPGEARGCIGCHQPRNEAPPARPPLAMRRPPALPRPQPGDATVPRPLHYPADVQPILDAHCVRCHGGEKPEGNLVLTGELTTFFSRSYEEIMRRNLIAYIQEFVGADPEAQKGYVEPLGPKALGSHASPLVHILRKGHHEVELSEAEWVRLITWVDANGPYYGSYFGRRNLKYRDLPDFRPVPTLEAAWGVAPGFRTGADGRR